MASSLIPANFERKKINKSYILTVNRKNVKQVSGDLFRSYFSRGTVVKKQEKIYKFLNCSDCISYKS